MATRVTVEKPKADERELPREPIAKVHKRDVVEANGWQRPHNKSIREIFNEMLKKNIALFVGQNSDAAIDLFADLFVNDVKEELGWHSQVSAIADSLEKNGANEALQQLGRAIRYHADQIWAARHVDDSKRSG